MVRLSNVAAGRAAEGRPGLARRIMEEPHAPATKGSPAVIDATPTTPAVDEVSRSEDAPVASAEVDLEAVAPAAATPVAPPPAPDAPAPPATGRTERRMKAAFFVGIMLFMMYAVIYSFAAPGVAAVDRGALAIPGNGPMVLELGTTNCPACRKMDPVIADLDRKYGGHVAFRIYNIDALPPGDPTTPAIQALARDVGVVATPTFIVASSDGRIAQTIIGMRRPEVFDEAIAALL